MENKYPDGIPCQLDHNGECLICDCWISDCAYDRYLKKDYKWETKEELEKMFKHLKEHPDLEVLGSDTHVYQSMPQPDFNILNRDELDHLSTK